MGCKATRRTIGNVDLCAFEVERDEPVFILRGNDITARDTLLMWIDFAQNVGAKKEKTEDAERILLSFKEWHRIRGTKVPD